MHGLPHYRFRFRATRPTAGQSALEDAGRRRNGDRLRALSRTGEQARRTRQAEGGGGLEARSQPRSAIDYSWPERPLPQPTESSLRTMPRAAGRKVDAYFGLPGRPRSQTLLAGRLKRYRARAVLELYLSSDHDTWQSAQHDNWSRLRQLLARWPRQEEPHAVARSRGRPARVEGGRQLHDVPCIPRRCGFERSATAI